MVLSHLRKRTLVFAALSLALLLLAACGNTQNAQTPAPSPTPVLGQRLLTQTGNALTTAKTLQGLLSMTVSGQSLSGTLDTQIWNATPGKSRSEVRQSTLSQFPNGAVTVSDGKKIWQYDPVKNVVYSGAAQSNGTGSSSLAGSGNGGQSQFVLNLVKSIFTQSNGTLQSSTGTIDGHAVYDISVVPQDNTNSTVNFTYSGDIYIDKTTRLPIKATLNIQGFGDVVLGFQKLVLNQPVPANTFTFVIPAGAKQLPLQQASQNFTNGNLLSFAQAQQQAGFHLLSIPADQSDYVLQGVNILGTTGSQIYTLHYMKGGTSFTIAQGKPLANLPVSNSQQISLRGTTATLSNQNGNNALIWTEKGIGINLTGLSKDQSIAVAQSLK